MTVSFSCKCDERQKPIKERNWVVWHRNHNHSHFESPKGQAHPSDYSMVFCKTCGILGSTKANYVQYLPDE